MTEKVTIQETGFITHDVLQIKTDRPSNYNFTPGQATDVTIDKDGWRDKKRPFTFTSLPQDGFLQFTIKIYPDHNGVTDMLQTLESGSHLILDDPWGAIQYNGPGIFLAGGAGITPFIAIFKHLAQNGDIAGNKLIFANKRERDIIMKSHFDRWLGNDFINVLSEERNGDYKYGHIDKNLIEDHANDFNKHFYLCGPPPMMDAVNTALHELDVPKDKIITEDL